MKKKKNIVEYRVSNIFQKKKKRKLVKHQDENKVLTILLEYHVSRRRIRTGNNRKMCTPLGLLELEAHLESGVSDGKDTRTACIAFECLLGNQPKSFFHFEIESRWRHARVIWFHLFGHPLPSYHFRFGSVHDEGDISTPSICKFIEWRSTGWLITPVVGVTSFTRVSY